MSAPTAPPKDLQFSVSVHCATCNKDLYASTSSDEHTFRQETAKAITASELHDCRSGPKK